MMQRLNQFERNIQVLTVCRPTGAKIWIVMKVIAEYLVAVLGVGPCIKNMVMPYFINFQWWWKYRVFRQVLFV